MSNILKIFYSPVEVFQDLKERPTWVWAFVIILLISLIFTFVCMPIIRQEAIRTLQERLPPDRAEVALRFFSGTGFYIRTAISSLFGAAVVIFLQAGVFMLILTLIVREIEFRKLLAVTVYANLIPLAGKLVRLPLILYKKTMEIHTDLLLFLPFIEKRTFLYRFLSQLDFFTVWALLLFSVGIATITKLERKTSILVVFILWLAFIIIMSVIGGLIPGR